MAHGYQTGRLDLPFVGLCTFAKSPICLDWDAIDADVAVLGAPFDFGTQWRAGARFGPRAIRDASTLFSFGHDGAYDFEDDVVYMPKATTRMVDIGDADIIHTDTETSHANIEHAVRKILKAGALPVVLGGDHSIAIGTLAGIARVRGRAPGVLWVDAHADVNAPQTTLSGNVHGMPVHFALAAKSAEADRFAYIGLRDLDPGEREAVRAHGMRAFTMSDVDRIGIAGVAEAALAVIADGPGSVHVSFDMDAIDPIDAPGVGTPVRGGLTYREAHLLMEAVAASGAIGSLEVTEINPILDRQNQTAILAVELILSALGKTVL